jgi:stage II sporulation protein AA (anti-sigma F factor antagonist)
MNPGHLTVTRSSHPSGDDRALLLSLAGRLDAASQAQAEEAIARELESVPGGPLRLILDCSALEFVSSAGLRVLLTAVRRLKPSGGRLILCAPRPAVRHLIELSGMGNLLRTCDTLEQALTQPA